MDIPLTVAEFSSCTTSNSPEFSDNTASAHCLPDDFLAMIDRVLRENKFWLRLHKKSFACDAKNDLWLYFTQHPEKLGNSHGYALISIRFALRDLLRKESERGLGQVPREVHQWPSGLEKDKRRFEMVFSDDDADARYDEEVDTPCNDISSFYKEPLVNIRALLEEEVAFEIEQCVDYQRLKRVFLAKSMKEKALALECKPADFRKQVNEAIDRLRAAFHERMGRWAE